jgi:histidinol-phosphate phosphatase family protein
MSRPLFDVVVPTAGRPALARLLRAIQDLHGPQPGSVLVVDDRPEAGTPLEVPEGISVLRGRGAGPAAARNVGWRASSAEWTVFVDDDVVPSADWLERLAGDLASADPDVAGVQGRLVVPLPDDRRPTDWERNVAGLARAHWATADMAYRRDALESVGGFDERFPRAYREDADLGLRILGADYRIVHGARTTLHPVGPVGFWTSVRLQAGNGDDMLMRALHGPGWQERAGAPRGCRACHLASTAAALTAAGGVCFGRRGVALLAMGAFFGSVGELAWRRIAPGPRTRREVATMAVTSAVLPLAATYHTLRGVLRARGTKLVTPCHKVSDAAGEPAGALRGEQVTLCYLPPEAVLFDRDGTLVLDVPYNADPERVKAAPGAREALDRLRAAGIRVGVVSNQSGIGRGLLTREQVDAVNQRVETLLGPMAVWALCPHAPDEDCACRKPSPGLVLDAARTLGVDPRRCAVVGDIGSDVEAAEAAGARAILVPNGMTRREEVATAPEVAGSLADAVDRLLGAAR